MIFHSNYIILLLTIFLAMNSSCDNGEEVINTNPSNLQIAVEVLDEGNVIVNATATNTDHFVFFPSELTPSDSLKNDDGIFEYKYEEAGTYVYEVRAYGKDGRFIRAKDNVVISFGKPDDVGKGYSTPIEYPDWNLLWNDEFSGTSLNTQFWKYEIGDGCPNLCGWGNNESQYYRRQNAEVGGGLLTITARKEPFSGKDYTSTRIITKDNFSFQYGRVEVRAKLPFGQGIWPAIWMLGQNQNTVGWPACGEIDIMEMIGGQGREFEIHGTAHWSENGGHVYEGGSKTLDVSSSDQFHVYSIIWDEAKIDWYVDDEKYFTLPINTTERTEFQNDFFFILNVAVGGNWPGYPDASTQFPTKMDVDYVRVFQKK